jgi:hypothetical protein
LRRFRNRRAGLPKFTERPQLVAFIADQRIARNIRTLAVQVEVDATERDPDASS